MRLLRGSISCSAGMRVEQSEQEQKLLGIVVKAGGMSDGKRCHSCV